MIFMLHKFYELTVTFKVALSLLELNNIHSLSQCGKEHLNIMLNLSFCVPQKKGNHAGLEWHEGEKMMKMLISWNPQDYRHGCL